MVVTSYDLHLVCIELVGTSNIFSCFFGFELHVFIVATFMGGGWKDSKFSLNDHWIRFLVTVIGPRYGPIMFLLPSCILVIRLPLCNTAVNCYWGWAD